MPCRKPTSTPRSSVWRDCFENERGPKHRAPRERRGTHREIPVFRVKNLADDPACELACGEPCSQACESSDGAVSHVMTAKLLLLVIRIYQLTLSKLILATVGPVCRFEPSCSRYAAACIANHGAIRGSLLSIRRLSKCHPFHPGGYDPPPPPRMKNDGTSETGVAGSIDGAHGHDHQCQTHSTDHVGVLPSG